MVGKCLSLGGPGHRLGLLGGLPTPRSSSVKWQTHLSFWGHIGSGLPDSPGTWHKWGRTDSPGAVCREEGGSGGTSLL